MLHLTDYSFPPTLKLRQLKIASETSSRELSALLEPTCLVHSPVWLGNALIFGLLLFFDNKVVTFLTVAVIQYVLNLCSWTIVRMGTVSTEAV